MSSSSSTEVCEANVLSLLGIVCKLKFSALWWYSLVVFTCVMFPFFSFVWGSCILVYQLIMLSIGDGCEAIIDYPIQAI